MKIRVENCYYELVKDLLLSQDSIISNVEKDGNDIIISLDKSCNQFDLINLLMREPLFQMMQNCHLSIV